MGKRLDIFFLKKRRMTLVKKKYESAVTGFKYQSKGLDLSIIRFCCKFPFMKPLLLKRN